jgi:ribosomal-protein-alanine N-acetyltransferase
MDRPTLHRPTQADAENLLAFELANRAYFEHWINARPTHYYALDAVKQAIAQAAHDQHADTAHQFLIKLNQQIVGRVNLTGIARGHFHKATLGYRIGQAHTGHGIARAAIDQVIDLAFKEMRLWRLEATARPENIGSVKVLERNGFHQFGRARQSLFMHGQWYDLLYFERHNSNWAGPG